MFQGHIAQGPAETISSVPDLTKLFDPAELWHNPEDCPDWPDWTESQFKNHGGMLGPRAAEARLMTLERSLNRGKRTHMPMADEAGPIKARLFSDSNPYGLPGWSRIGINLFPSERSGTTQDQCAMIAECAHIRGYLRKMNARQAAADLDADRSKKRASEGKVSSFLEHRNTWKQRLTELVEAEARHQQRIADAAAAAEAAELRQHIAAMRQDAQFAASQLGKELPED